MLFGKRKRIVKRILVVEDEPLTAFDNETMLTAAGYEVVATLDGFDEALEAIAKEQIDLILSDIRLRSDASGIDLARAASARGIPTLFASGHVVPAASEVAIGCLQKPYTDRQLKAAIEAVDRHLSGKKVKPPEGLELFVRTES
ncbi:MAG: response regulator [Sphingomonas sp.]|nr:response regulator [Sphingomonas sp.]